MRLFVSELRKLFSLRNMLVLAAAMLVQIVVCLIPHQYTHEYVPNIYKRYIEELSGTYTPQKREFIENRNAEIEDLIARSEEMENAYAANSITTDEYRTYSEQLDEARREQTTVAYLLKKCDYFDTVGAEMTFFDDTAWADFLSHQSYDFILALALVILLIPIFDTEYSSKTRNMLLITKRGRSETCAYKLCVAALLGFCLTFCFGVIRYLCFLRGAGGNGDMPIRNLLNYAAFGQLRLTGYVWRNILLQSAAWAVLALILCVITNACRNTAFSFFLSFVCSVAPAFLPNTPIWRYLFCAVSLNGLYPAEVNLGVQACILTAKAIICIVLTLLLWQRGIPKRPRQVQKTA